MRCIFCAEDSSLSKSIEHIIPESLGNTDHVLPKGVVCDHCNNYFARKIEKPLLESDYFTQLRQRQQIRNKRGRIPSSEVIIPRFRTSAKLNVDDKSLWFEGRNQKHTDEIYTHLLKNEKFTTYSFVPSPPSNLLVSRFLSKVSVELFVSRLLNVSDWEHEFFSNNQIAILRAYARRGDQKVEWPFHSREIYDENASHTDRGNSYQVLHEMDFLWTESEELYCIICIFGHEYALNVGGPDISGYKKWLEENSSRSPLYLNKTGKL